MKFINYITLFICMGGFITACTSNENDIPEAQGTPLQFACRMNAERGTQTLDITTMGVVAYNTGTTLYDSWDSKNTPNFMVNQLMEQKLGVWTYQPVKYWPGNPNKVSFFAYSPHNVQSDDNNSGIGVSGKTLTYTTPTSMANHTDLLIASPVKDQIEGETIIFQFNHALACVSFGVTSDTKTPTQIILKGIATKGTWELDGSGWSVTALGEITIDYLTPNGANDHFLMLLPQELSKKSVAIYYNDGTTTSDIPLEGITTQWEAGKQYVYNITDNYQTKFTN